MGLFDFTKRLKPIKRTYTLAEIIGAITSGTLTDVITSPRSAENESVWINRCVSIISTTAAALPWHIVNAKGETDEDAERILRRPNYWMTGTDLLMKVYAQMSIFGYGVFYVPPEGGVVLFDADTVEVAIYEKRVQYRHKGAMVASERVVLFPNFSPYMKLTGQSDLVSVIDIANLAENAFRLTNNILTGGGIMQGILVADHDIDETEAQVAKKAFKESHGGIDNAGQVAVFGGGFKWQKIGLDPKDFAGLEIANVSRDQIATAFGVPSIYMNDMSSVDYANARVQTQMFYETNIRFRANSVEERINIFLLPLLFPGKDLSFKYDWRQVKALQADALLQEQINEIRLRTLKETINEQREREGMPPVPWGNAPWGTPMQIQVAADLPVKQLQLEPMMTRTLSSENMADLLKLAALTETVPGEITKPEDTTGKYIRIRVRDPKDFEDGTLRTVTIDETAGIYSVMGKLKGETTMTPQNFMFLKSKGWNLEKARAWVKDHGYTEKGFWTEDRQEQIWKGFIAKEEPQERRFAKSMTKLFKRAEKRIIADVEKQAAFPDAILRDVGGGEEIGLFMDDYEEETTSLYLAFGLQATESFAAQWSLEKNITKETVLAWVKQRGLRQSKYIAETTAEQVQAVIAKIVSEGGGIGQQVEALTSYFDGLAYRAERVARTEVVGTNNWAFEETLVENGVEKKMWLSARDERTRGGPGKEHENDEFDHWSMDGTVVLVSEPFTVSGARGEEEIMQPGDAEGSPGNIINCRCSIAPAFED